MAENNDATVEVATSSRTGTHKPWVERYRPQSLTDVAHQTEVVATLQNAVQTGRLPHMLFYGPPGSGKTSVALALCRQLWHPSQWHRRVLELNASDERGISVVRDKIKHFASLAVGGTTGGSKKAKKSFFGQAASSAGAPSASKDKENKDNDNEDEYPNPAFKIIILDEADTVTPDAQAALRRIIEANSRITRFILICNYVTRIIEPLASRCAKFRFAPLPPASMKARLQSIAHAEGCDDDELTLLDDILDQADGDMRRAVTTLQSVHSLAAGGEIVTRDTLSEIAGHPPPSVLQELWETALQSTNSFDAMQASVQDVVAQGYAAKFLLLGLLPLVAKSAVLSERHKAELALRMAEAEKNMVEGADEFLQLMTVCSLAFTCLRQATAASN